MHVAIAMGAILLGGVVLNSPSDDEEQGFQTPAESLQGAPESPTPYAQPQRPAMGSPQSGAMRGGAAMGGQQPNMQQRPAFMPTAPTDGAALGGQTGVGQPMMASPTSGASSGHYGRQGPMAPTERRSSMSQMRSGYNPTSSGALDQTRRFSLQNSSSSFMTPPISEKAFSGYRPSSGVSPYMNLFRRDDLGTIDNYTTLVRPELEQRNVNQQYGHDIRSLERNTQLQRAGLQRLDQETRTLQGVGTPQFYQNTGNYYQGYGR